MKVIVMARTVDYIRKSGRTDILDNFTKIAERISAKDGYNLIEIK